MLPYINPPFRPPQRPGTALHHDTLIPTPGYVALSLNTVLSTTNLKKSICTWGLKRKPSFQTHSSTYCADSVRVVQDEETVSEVLDEVVDSISSPQQLFEVLNEQLVMVQDLSEEIRHKGLALRHSEEAR